MKEGDLVRIKNVRGYGGKPFTVGRLLEIEEHSVRVSVDGIGGYFIFSKEHVVGVIEEEEEIASNESNP